MPELPEVETICRGIKPYLVGQTVKALTIGPKKLRWPIPRAVLKKDFHRQTIHNVSRRAKYIIIHSDRGQLVIHLGMSGTLRIENPEMPLRKHDHFECVLSSGNSLRFHDPRRFGAILWAPNQSLLPQFSQLGLEPFDRAFNGHYLFTLAQRHKIAVKNFIMDNKIVVGVGNIYASESLFAAKIHPAQKAYTLSLAQCHQLCSSIREILQRAIASGGTTLKDFAHHDGKTGYFKVKLKVYDRHNQPCMNCRTLIQSARIGQRSSYYCPTCQI